MIRWGKGSSRVWRGRGEYHRLEQPEGGSLIGKQLEFLKETVPQSTRIAVLANPASPGHAPLLHNLTVAAEALKLSLHVVELRRAEELDDAFAAMTRAVRTPSSCSPSCN